MNIRVLEEIDIPLIVKAFEKSDWQIKPASIFEQYFSEQSNDERICFIAFWDDQFAGYVTLKWYSNYKNFAKNNIPEISDLNVLPKFRNKSIGIKLIEKCEKHAAERSDIIGIGVGLYADYGAAQNLYTKRGYVADGCGITYNYEYVIPGQKYFVDDDLILWFTKKLDN